MQQAIPKLGVSLWVLGHQGPLAPYADEHAFLSIVRLMDRLLMLAPDFRPSLWTSGVFHYLLCGSIQDNGSGILRTEVAEFLRKYHALEVTKPPPTNGSSGSLPPPSWLEPFLPMQLIRVLAETKPDIFARVFNCDLEAPDVIWGSKFRLACLERASTQVRDIINHLFENPIETPLSLEVTHCDNTDLYPQLTEKSQVCMMVR